MAGNKNIAIEPADGRPAEIKYICPMYDLDKITEFKGSPELRQKLAEYSLAKTLKEGEVIVSDNAYITDIPIVTKGSLRVMRTEEDGREILLYYVKSGESCVMSFLGGWNDEKCRIRAIAEEDSEILFLPVSKVNLFINEYPQWLNYIFRLYNKRFEELLKIIDEVAFKKVDERLLNLLNKKVELTGSKQIYVTHEQLANELGTARVVVSRLLKQLEDEGRVALARNKIQVM